MSGSNSETRAVVGSENHRQTHSWLVTLAAVSCVLYLPFAWLLNLDFMTNSYHFQWLCLWPILPGLVVGLPFKSWLDDPGLFVGSGVATLAGLVVLTYIGTRDRRGLPIALILASTISIPTSILSYWAFLH